MKDNARWIDVVVFFVAKIPGLTAGDNATKINVCRNISARKLRMIPFPDFGSPDFFPLRLSFAGAFFQRKERNQNVVYSNYNANTNSSLLVSRKKWPN